MPDAVERNRVYQVAIEDRRRAREALRLAQLLVDETDHRVAQAFEALPNPTYQPQPQPQPNTIREGLEEARRPR